MDLTNIVTVKHLLNKYALWPRKKLGQNFLINKNTLEKIVQSADIQKEDRVIEIGTGVGVLTQELFKCTSHLTTIEIDENLKKLHQEVIPHIHVTYKNALDYAPPATPYKVIANIPYYITSPLLSHFLKDQYMSGNKRIPKLIVLLIQKEVAEKLCASEKLNVLALNCQPFAKTEIVATVPKSHFFPPPQVDSAIIKIIPYEKPLITAPLKTFYKLIESAFSQKRKKIKNALPSKLHLSQTQAITLLEKVSIDPSRRPETLTIKEWDKLNDVFALV